MNLGEKRAVTAILVLCGLPYASFSSILAHEAMHAAIKLDPSFPTRLPSQVIIHYFRNILPNVFDVVIYRPLMDKSSSWRLISYSINCSQPLFYDDLGSAPQYLLSRVFLNHALILLATKITTSFQKS